FSSIPVAPGPMEYGEVTIGQKLTQTIAFKNNGTANLVITLTGFTNDGGNFGYVFPSPKTIAPGATDQVYIRCQPNKVGMLSGQLTLQSNDSSQNQVSYTLNCVG